MAIEYRWADNQIDRLPGLAADLVRRRVAVIARIGGIACSSAAKAATTTIPIVFGVGEDPVKLGLVASLARPGGNLTGINFLSAELAAKRLELLRELVPRPFVSPCSSIRPVPTPEATLTDVQAAARAIGLQIQVLNASTSREIDAAFAALCARAARRPLRRHRPLLHGRRVQLPIWRALRYSRDLFGRVNIPKSAG